MAFTINDRVYVDLSGEDGNVYFLLGIARRLARETATAEAQAKFDDWISDLVNHPYEDTLAFINEMFGGLIVFMNVPEEYREILNLSSTRGTIAS